MSLNAAMIEILVSKGLSAQDILDVARASEVRKDPTAAERMARYRARKGGGRVTRNVTHEPPYDNNSTPSTSDEVVAPQRKTPDSRLPDDFTAPDEWIDWAMKKKGWSRADAVDEAECFARYWQAKAGKDALKRDWLKTWQNWVANSRRLASIQGGKPAAEPSYLHHVLGQRRASG